LREVKQVTPGPFDVPSSWTQDGKDLAFTRGFSATGGNTDIFVVSVDDPKSLRPLVATDAVESFPEFSPDGKWIAYCSRVGDRSTLYVQPYPGPGPRVPVTSTIGNEGQLSEPAWSKMKNSNELFYRLGTNMMSLRFTISGSEFIPGKPEKLFEAMSLGTGTTVRATYDVAPDGRFLLNQPDENLNKDRTRTIYPPTLRLILNWDVELRRLLSAEH